MSHQVESRSIGGVSEIKLHRINGETAWLQVLDARRAVSEHPEEWAMTPFSAAEQRAAQRDMPIDPDHVSDWRVKEGLET